MAKKQKQRLSRKEREATRQAAKQFMFVPDDVPLDLTKDEKLRSTALLMAIQYVEKTICNDAAMYQALRADGKTLAAASVPYVIQSAINFEAFLLGRYSAARDGARADAEADHINTATDKPDAAPEPGEVMTFTT